MGFFDDVKKTVTDLGQGASQKTKSFTDGMKINSQINDQKKNLSRMYEDLGRMLYQEETVRSNPKCAQLLNWIDNGEMNLKNLEQQLSTSKGSIICKNCGAQVMIGNAFCQNCGAKIEMPQAHQPQGAPQNNNWQPNQQQGNPQNNNWQPNQSPQGNSQTGNWQSNPQQDHNNWQPNPQPQGNPQNTSNMENSQVQNQQNFNWQPANNESNPNDTTNQ